MSIFRTIALSSSLVKLPLAGLGAATGGGLVTYFLIVPKDDKVYFLQQKEDLNSQLGEAKATLKTKSEEDTKIFLEIEEITRKNSISRRLQTCNKEKMESYNAGKEWAHNLLSNCY